jgi:hypothetical protein
MKPILAGQKLSQLIAFIVERIVECEHFMARLRASVGMSREGLNWPEPLTTSAASRVAKVAQGEPPRALLRVGAG